MRRIYGIWQTHTWANVLEEVRVFSLGLRALGLKRDDTIALLGDNRPRLYWTFAAAQALGAIPVPVYQDSVAEEMAFVLSHAEVTMAVVENQEQVDKLLSIADRVPTLRAIIYDDPRGLLKYDSTLLHSYDEVRDAGRAEMRTDPDVAACWKSEIDRGRGSDISVMLYTSGTTGRPKGVMLSHENIVVSSQNGNLFDDFTEDDTLIAYLPMAWVGDHIFSYGQSFAAGFCVACPESPETVVEDRREIGPTYFFAPPRVFENMLTQIMVRMDDAGRLNKAMFHYFLRVARRARREEGSTASRYRSQDRVLYWLGDKIIYAPLRNRMGFSSNRVSPIPPAKRSGQSCFRFYRRARHQPQAALWPDRSERLHHAATRRRGLSRDGRQARAGRRNQD